MKRSLMAAPSPSSDFYLLTPSSLSPVGQSASTPSHSANTHGHSPELAKRKCTHNGSARRIASSGSNNNATTGQDFPLTLLPDFALAFIFSCFSLHDHLSILFLVCKKWRPLCLQWKTIAWAPSLDLLGVRDEDMSYVCSLYQPTRAIVSSGKVTDSGIQHLKRLHALQHLNLCKCINITNRSLAAVGVLSVLRSLSLRRCRRINDSGLLHLRCLSLTSLDLSKTAVTSAGLAALQGLPLTALNLNRLRVTDSGMQHIQSLPLTALSLDGCEISNEGLKLIPPSVVHLNLSNLGWLTDTGLEAVQDLALETLFLDGNNITNACLQYFRHMPLHTLSLNSVSIAGVASALLKALPLKLLSISFITDSCLSHLAHIELEGLCVKSSYVTDRALQYLNPRQLRFLDLSGCAVTDDALSQLANYVHLLRLGLSGCSISNKGLAALTGLKLDYLNLRCCRHVTDAGFAHVGKISTLKHLNVAHTGLTDEGLAALTGLPHLFHLDVQGCAVTDRGLNLLNSLTLRRLCLANTRVSHSGRFRWECICLRRRQCGPLDNLNLSPTGDYDLMGLKPRGWWA